MSPRQDFMFTHKELVALLIKALDLHKGIWGLSVTFGLGTENVGAGADLEPAAILAVLKIGLQQSDEESNLALDAAKIHPAGRAGRPR